MTAPRQKVLFTSHTANFQKFNRPFMRMLKEKGYTVHYASAGEEEILDADKAFVIPFERSPFSINNLRAIFQLKKVIDAEGYDIIHTHTPMGSVVTRLAAIAARKRGTRVIYTAHGFHFFKGAPLMNWLIYYPVEKIMAHFTDTLITINEEDYTRALKSFKTNVVYTSGIGVDLNKFQINMTKGERGAYRTSLGLELDDFVMIYVAELLPRKNQIWMISNIAGFLRTHEDAHLLLVGSDGMDGKCQKLVEQLKLEEQIHFLGYRKDIVSLNNSSDLAVSSSTQEGLGIYQLEALATNTPILGTKIRGHILEHMESYELNNSEEFNQKLDALYVRLPHATFPEEFSLDSALKFHAGVYSI